MKLLDEILKFLETKIKLINLIPIFAIRMLQTATNLKINSYL